MSRFLAALLSFAALAACILSGIDAQTTVIRAGIAFFVGHLAGAFWESIFGKKPEPEVLNVSLVLAAEQVLEEETTEGEVALETKESAEAA